LEGCTSSVRGGRRNAWGPKSAGHGINEKKLARKRLQARDYGSTRFVASFGAKTWRQVLARKLILSGHARRTIVIEEPLTSHSLLFGLCLLMSLFFACYDMSVLVDSIARGVKWPGKWRLSPKPRALLKMRLSGFLGLGLHSGIHLTWSVDVDWWRSLPAHPDY